MLGIQNFMRGAAGSLPQMPKPNAGDIPKPQGQENLLAQKAKAPEAASVGFTQQLNNAIFQ